MIEIVRSEHVRVTGLPQFMKPFLKKDLVIQNPAYAEAVKYGRLTRGISKFLTMYRDLGKYVTVPRGFYEDVIELVESVGEKYVIRDERTEFPRQDIKHSIVLRDTQKPAVDTMLTHTNGLLVAPPGAGKTIIALYIAAKLGQPTLWVTHTKRLFEQVIDRANSFMEIGKIGRIIKGEIELGDFLNVAMVQTMNRKLTGLRNNFGTVILDECHHCPAIIFSEVVNYFNAKYVFGMTATAYRRDGLEPLLFHALGNIKAVISRHELIKAGEIVVPSFVQVETGIKFYYDGRNFATLVSDIIKNAERNELIVNMISHEASNPANNIFVLTARVAHVKKIYRMLKLRNILVGAATGKDTDKKNFEAIRSFAAGKTKVLVSTYQYIGEGFDHAGINRIYILTPIGIKGKTALVQIVGRAQRAQGEKHAIVYDFIDAETLLEIQANARLRNLREEWGSALEVKRLSRK